MTKRILIIEDNELNLKLFKDLLEAHGYETCEIKDGREMMSVIIRFAPDLILMDIQLPEISGLDLTRQIKADESIRHIPVIAVTAFAMKDDEKKILEAGCEAYISKPISIGPFLHTVQQFMGKTPMAAGV